MARFSGALLFLCLVHAFGRRRGVKGGVLLDVGTKVLPCLNDCSSALGNRGTCVKGICVCEPRFSGPDCSISKDPDLPNKNELLASREGPFNSTEGQPVPGETCVQAECDSICYWGGECVDARTCSCRVGALDEEAAQAVEDAKANAAGFEDELANTDGDAVGVSGSGPVALEVGEMRALTQVLAGLGAPLHGGDPCLNWEEWNTVRCSTDGHVVGIDVGRMGLRGTIAPDVGELPYLREFFANNNELHGPIPDALLTIPALETVLLYKNKLSGALPRTIEAPALRTLVAYGNEISGTIPHQFGFCFGLQYLDLSYNKLTGKVPPHLGFIPTLDTLYLNNNDLSGNVPDALGLLTAAKHLRVENNPRLRGNAKMTSADGLFHDPEHQRYFEGAPQQEMYDAPANDAGYQTLAPQMG